MQRDSYQSKKQKRDYVDKENRSDFHRYLRDSQQWQSRMFYVTAGAVIILFGIFILLIQIAVRLYK